MDEDQRGAGMPTIAEREEAGADGGGETARQMADFEGDDNGCQGPVDEGRQNQETSREPDDTQQG